MLACILKEPNNIEIQEIPTPAPSKGEILVKIKAALTCGTDLKAFKRGHLLIPMPGVFGHEFSGVVAKIGKGVKKFKEGDKIMAVHSAPCLSCLYCKKGFFNLCENIMKTKVLGAFAEYIVLPPHIVKQNIFIKPEKLSFEEAAFLEPLSCVVHGISTLNIKKNNRALIIGGGPIGLLHLLILKSKGAIVTLIDKHLEKLSVAKELGADFIYKSESLITPSHNAKYDFIFECTGRKEVWESSINAVRRGGTIILFGGCKSGTQVCYDASRLHYDEITLKGVFHFNPSDVKKAYELLSNSRINVTPLISGKYTLKNISKAFAKLSRGIGIKYAILP